MVTSMPDLSKLLPHIAEYGNREPLLCVDMHTSGEPTRIVLQGFPSLQGTLLEQRAEAKEQHDDVRRRLMLEPRGHNDMYGAILIRDTELVSAGDAHIGVLFSHNDGFSTMCGHATIALGRFLVDTQDLAVFPKRTELRYDFDTKSVEINLHAPCGLIKVRVPALTGGTAADPSRSVSFLSVPSFATGISVQVPIHIDSTYRWHELCGDTSIVVDFAYGGAFYCLVSPEQLGFYHFEGSLTRLDYATKQLKAAINDCDALKPMFAHPDSDDLGFLYSILVVREGLGAIKEGTTGAETGLCFFADQQFDRSATGSAVVARVALAWAKGERSIGERWTYQSVVSNAFGGCGGFVGTVEGVERMKDGREAVRARVEGRAWYTGVYQTVLEEEDQIGRNAFKLGQLDIGRGEWHVKRADGSGIPDSLHVQ